MSYPNAPRTLIEQIIHNSVTNKGNVTRSYLPSDQIVYLMARAWIRHNQTSYEQAVEAVLHKNGGRKSRSTQDAIKEIRQKYNLEADDILKQWK